MRVVRGSASRARVRPSPADQAHHGPDDTNHTYHADYAYDADYSDDSNHADDASSY